jgi:exosortase B
MARPLASVTGPLVRWRRADAGAWVLLAGGFAALYGPLVWFWWQAAWQADRHEFVILCVCLWLLYRQRATLAALPDATHATHARAGLALFALGLLMGLFGRVAGVSGAVVLSLMAVLAGCLWQFKGAAALRVAWFSLIFLLFAYPLPYELVLWVTGPLKEAVSAAAVAVLDALGFPVARTGVVITIGQYQLLVLEACAGLQTMFTLEAMGLLYASLIESPGVLRRFLLAVLVVPISFVSNVIRVILLALVTYTYGDAAGQGYLHSFAGIVLFLVALCLTVAVDTLLTRYLPDRNPLGAAGPPPSHSPSSAPHGGSP